jgi:DNA-binding transcriptional ArsR family regulator
VSYAQFVPLQSRNVRKYIPIDLLLDSPRIRILRLLSRHDWISGHEIAEELGVLWSPQIRNAYASHLTRMRKSGLVLARDGVHENCGGGPDYRIAPHAAADLPKIIDRAMRARR